MNMRKFQGVQYCPLLEPLHFPWNGHIWGRAVNGIGDKIAARLISRNVWESLATIIITKLVEAYALYGDRSNIGLDFVTDRFYGRGKLFTLDNQTIVTY